MGYGLRDQRINQYIKDVFLTEQDRQMFVVDIREPETELLAGEDVCYVKGGVVDMDIAFILDRVKQHESTA